MTLAAVARDSAAAVVVEEGWAAWDSTWDILAMAEEATILWKFDEAIVVGNADTADMDWSMTGLSSDLNGTWEYIEMDKTPDLIEFLQVNTCNIGSAQQQTMDEFVYFAVQDRLERSHFGCIFEVYRFIEIITEIKEIYNTFLFQQTFFFIGNNSPIGCESPLVFGLVNSSSGH